MSSSSSSDDEDRYTDYDNLADYLLQYSIVPGCPYLMCPEEDSDVDYYECPAPRCVDSLQNLGMFNHFETRRCDEKALCSAPHKHPRTFGRRVMDLYSLIIKRRKDIAPEACNLKGRLNGFIEFSEEPGNCVFKVKRGDADAELVDLSSEAKDRHTVTLYGPANRLYMCDRDSGVSAGLTLDDRPVVQCDSPDLHMYEDAEVFGPGNRVGRACFRVNYNWTSVPYLNNRLIEYRLDPGTEYFGHLDDGPRLDVSPMQIFLRFAVMDPGLVAEIRIKLLDHGDVASVSGSIYARPCCLTYPIPLIVPNKATTVDGDGFIELKRTLVAVPPHASLVIGADHLLNNHDHSVVEHAITFFTPAKDGPPTTQVMYLRTESWLKAGYAPLQVEVKWIPHEYDYAKTKLAIARMRAERLCPRCNEPETMLHFLFHCPFACPFAELVCVGSNLINIDLLSGMVLVQQIWKMMEERRTPEMDIAARLSTMAWIMWSLWLARNAIIFRDEFLNPVEVLAKAESLQEVFNCHGAEVSVHNAGNVVAAPMLIGSLCPSNSYKINFDGAYHAVSSTGLGASVVSNSNGNTISSVAKLYSAVSSPLLIEAMALRDAIKLAIHLRLSEVIFEGDAMVANSKVDFDCDVVVQDCKQLIGNQDSFSFVFVRRNCNWVAHLLAKKALRDVNIRCNPLA